MTSNVIWKLLIREKVKKSLNLFPKNDQKRVLKAFFDLIHDPYLGDIVKLESKDNLWRRRVGPYRVKFQIKNAEKIIYVYEIKRRTSSTY